MFWVCPQAGRLSARSERRLWPLERFWRQGAGGQDRHDPARQCERGALVVLSLPRRGASPSRVQRRIAGGFREHSASPCRREGAESSGVRIHGHRRGARDRDNLRGCAPAENVSCRIDVSVIREAAMDAAEACLALSASAAHGSAGGAGLRSMGRRHLAERAGGGEPELVVGAIDEGVGVSRKSSFITFSRFRRCFIRRPSGPRALPVMAGRIREQAGRTSKSEPVRSSGLSSCFSPRVSFLTFGTDAPHTPEWLPESRPAASQLWSGPEWRWQAWKSKTVCTSSCSARHLGRNSREASSQGLYVGLLQEFERRFGDPVILCSICGCLAKRYRLWSACRYASA